MRRSRSSFDLSVAAKAAATIGGAPGEAAPAFGGVALVSFEVKPSDDAAARPPGEAPHEGAHGHAIDGEAPSPVEAPRPAHEVPKLPDLSAIRDPSLRCVEVALWIRAATGATAVFIADAEGSMLAGDLPAGMIDVADASAAASSAFALARSIGAGDGGFELHVGEGPCLQLIGFTAPSGSYLAGLTRAAPLTPRQAQGIRLACLHAVGSVVRATAAPPSPPRDVAAEGAARVRRLLAHLAAHAPEPHVVRLRLALRSGLSPEAIEHADGLAPGAVAMLETAALDILGLDRADLAGLV